MCVCVCGQQQSTTTTTTTGTTHSLSIKWFMELCPTLALDWYLHWKETLPSSSRPRHTANVDKATADCCSWVLESLHSLLYSLGPVIKGSQNILPLLWLQELGKVLGAEVYDKINDKIGTQNRPEKETPILLWNTCKGPSRYCLSWRRFLLLACHNLRIFEPRKMLFSLQLKCNYVVMQMYTHTHTHISTQIRTQRWKQICTAGRASQFFLFSCLISSPINVTEDCRYPCSVCESGRGEAAAKGGESVSANCQNRYKKISIKIKNTRSIRKSCEKSYYANDTSSFVLACVCVVCVYAVFFVQFLSP